MKLDQKPCRTCEHSTEMSGAHKFSRELACLYILNNPKNEPRGCPAGEGCTRYTKRKRKNYQKQSCSKKLICLEKI